MRQGGGNAAKVFQNKNRNMIAKTILQRFALLTLGSRVGSVVGETEGSAVGPLVGASEVGSQ